MKAGRSVARWAVGVAATFLAVTGLATAPAAAAQTEKAGDYIVVLRDGVSDSGAVAAEHGRRNGSRPTRVYRHALKGYAARLTPSAVRSLRADSRVASVTPDGEVHAYETQFGATWGLDRVDQRPLPLSATFTYTGTGAGVTAYVIDSGIKLDHLQFFGRAKFGFDAFGGDGSDCNGHGTHVAGTIGGTTHGVAKGVTLVAVRVLNCSGSGTWSGVIAGIDWVTSHHAAGAPAVANMSLGGGANSAIDAAVRNSVADGVSYAVAAGNGNTGGVAQDACKYSPARVSDAITISATDSADRKASWANYGSCVDWFAPGVSITSAWHTDSNATRTISGTSMATPHTAGVAALYLETTPLASPAAVSTALYNATTQGVVKSSKTTNNHLLFTSY